jgi:hypothetical protein
MELGREGEVVPLISPHVKPPAWAREKAHKEASWISPLGKKLLEETRQRLKAPGIEKEIDGDAKDQGK